MCARQKFMYVFQYLKKTPSIVVPFLLYSLLGHLNPMLFLK
jgi:hypothetical protein